MAVAQQRRAVTASLPAPIGGWNARDSLAEMNPLDAVQMVNFFPTPTDVTLRKGYTKVSTGIAGQVLSLMNYSSPTGSKLFAANTTTIYDASTSTATASLTGNTDGKWRSEEHTSELQSPLTISYAVFCLDRKSVV